MTLTEFLLARIAEDEAVADLIVREVPEEDDIWSLKSRVLAECEAKRQIVDEWLDADNTLAGTEREGDWEAATGWSERREALDPVLKFLALPYADHPDYREEWKP